MTKQRISRADLMQYVVGGSAATRQVGALVVLDQVPGGAAELRRVLGSRLAEIPRFRQRLRWPRPGGGRPYWVTDPAFDPDAHVTAAPCPPPGDDRSLLDLAALRLVAPLPGDRPLWSATVVTGLAGGRTGLVIVMDHVVADGIAGLALLANLADRPGPAARGSPPAGSPPAAGAGLPDSGGTPGGTTDRRRADRTRRGRRRLRNAVAELGGRLPRRLPATSLNRPTGERRQIHTVTADLAAVREFAHSRGGTVNDVLLAAIGGALRKFLASRGEELREVCVSVPVSGRPRGGQSGGQSGGQLGNQVGIMPVLLPTGGDLGDRARTAAKITGELKAHARGASAAILVPVFLLLARVGIVRWFVDHQRLIHTFLTNMRGPAQRLAIAGAPVSSIVALPLTNGNVTVTFAALSYNGTLRITLLSDPGQVPDAAVLASALRAELSAIPSPRLAGLRAS